MAHRHSYALLAHLTIYIYLSYLIVSYHITSLRVRIRAACAGTQVLVHICANQDSMLRLSRPQKCKLLRNGVSLDLSRPISLSCRTVCGRPWQLLAAQKDVGTCSLQTSSVRSALSMSMSAVIIYIYILYIYVVCNYITCVRINIIL